MMYLAKRYIRLMKKKNDLTEVAGILDPNKDYCIWGAGQWGRRCIKFLQSLPVNYKIISIYDSFSRYNELEGIKVVTPNEQVLKNQDCVILIATSHYEDEIRKKLISMNLEEGKDFKSIFFITESIIRNCLKHKKQKVGIMYEICTSLLKLPTILMP